jgi:hypothetical protein
MFGFYAAEVLNRGMHMVFRGKSDDNIRLGVNRSVAIFDESFLFRFRIRSDM